MEINKDLKLKWLNYQNKNSKKIIKTDYINLNNIKYIGGFDISFSKKNNKKACAYLTIIDFKTNEIVYEDYLLCEMDIEYVSGFLGFREIPHYSKLFQKLLSKNIKYYPDIILFDGYGIFHQRNFGLASHFGYEFNIPTIGVGKTLLFIDGLNNSIMDDFLIKCKNKGDYIELIGKTTNNIYGAAVKSSENSKKPIYISIGHKISLKTAVEIIIQTCKYKLPEPIRNSDIKSKCFL
jgi:endonuclease V